MSRIPSKKIYPWYIRLYHAYQKKKYGQVLNSTLIWSRRPSLLFGFLTFLSLIQRQSIHPQLRARILTLVSQLNHCAFCSDLNTAQVDATIDIDDKVALEYARAVTQNSTVDDKLFGQLREHFSEDQIVELTALIAFQNCSSKFNAALNVESQGFCEAKRKDVGT